MRSPSKTCSSRRQRPQRAQARARARRRDAGRGRSRPAGVSNTRRPRSSGRWSATAAPRSRRCSRWCKLLLGLDRRADAARRGRRARRSPSATCIAGPRAAPIASFRPQPTRATSWRSYSPPPRHRQAWRFGAANPHDRDRAPARTHSRKASEPHRRRRQRRRLRRVRAAVDVLRPRRARRRDHALRIHTHVREDALAALRVRDAARAGAVRAVDRRQRHRSEGRAGGAVGHRAARTDSRDRARRPRATDRDPRRRQENLRAHRPRAEGSAAARAGGAVAAGDRRARRADRARRCALGAREPGVSSASRRESCRSRHQDDRTASDADSSAR